MKPLFSSNPHALDISLLMLRLFFGLTMMLNHGLGKLENLFSGAIDFVDVLGMGETVSLALAVFSEFFCSLLIAIGLFSRLATIPLIITMAVAAFDIHWEDGFRKMELALTYLSVYGVLFLSGPGKYSMDNIILKK